MKMKINSKHSRVRAGLLATAWHFNQCFNPATDDAMRPILHLNAYKISNLTLVARIFQMEDGI